MQSTNKTPAKPQNATFITLRSLFYFRKLIKRGVSVNEAKKPGEDIKRTLFQFILFTF